MSAKGCPICGDGTGDVCLRCAGSLVRLSREHASAVTIAVWAARRARKAMADAAIEIADSFTHNVTAEEEKAVTPAAYSNATVRRIVAGIRAARRGGGR